MSDAIEDIRAYLDGMEFMRTMHAFQEGLKYQSYEGLVSAEGFTFTEYGDIIRRMTPKQCFDNCRRKALTYPGKYTYCEGWASALIPVHHAWLCDSRNRVIDPTWGHQTNRAYLGIRFEFEQVQEAWTKSRGYFSMLYPPFGVEHPLLMKGDDDATATAD